MVVGFGLFGFFWVEDFFCERFSLVLIIYFLNIILLVSIPWAEKVEVWFSHREFYQQVQFP